MVHKCVVPGCLNQSYKKTDADGKPLKFHRLPHKNKKLLQTWLDLIGRALTEITVNSRVCSAHFSERGLRKFGSKVPDVFPWSISRSSQLLHFASSVASQSSSPPHSPQHSASPTASQSSSPPHSPQHSASPTTSQSSSPQSPQPLQSSLSTSLPPETHVPCAACIVFRDHSYSKHLHTHSLTPSHSMLSCDVGSSVPLVPPSSSLTTRNTGTQTSTSLYLRSRGTQTSTSLYFCIERFMDDDAAINFYTGFESYQILHTCFQYLGKPVDHLKYWGSKSHTLSIENRGTSRLLTPINEFFLVLCRLRCGLMECDLAYRFGVSQSTVSRIMTTWINFIYYKFKEINIWPSRTQVLHFMPQSFKEFYPTTRCIIDATEIFIQTPSDPQAQQLTFSSYKNHNTFKVLIGITPSGATCFISKLYGGSISDRELTQKSGLLDLLEPGDSVMAGKGFTIADLTELRGVTLNVPPMKHDDQFTEREVLTTRRIASLRIHVERAIGRIKILNDILNNMARIADQIFYVCAILCNFNPPLCSR